jgi:hypothetical protein
MRFTVIASILMALALLPHGCTWDAARTATVAVHSDEPTESASPRPYSPLGTLYAPGTTRAEVSGGELSVGAEEILEK